MKSISHKIVLLWAAVAVTQGSASGWSARQNISNINPGRGHSPRVAVDANDHLHVVWYGGSTNDSSSWAVQYQSYDGSSWSGYQSLSPTMAGNPDIAVDGNGDLHVVWHGYGNPEDIYYRKRTGSTWGSIINLSNTGGRSLYGRLAVNSDASKIMVVWHESGQVGGNYDTFARRCLNGTWQTVENVSADSGLSRNANIDLDGSGNFHVVWEDVTADHSYYRKYNSAGTWEGKLQIDNTLDRAYGPDVIADSNGTLHFVWHDDSPDDWEIYYRTRTGSTWGSIVNLSNHSSDTDAGADIALDSNDNPRVVWHDYNNIYYRYNSSGTWLPKETLSGGSSQKEPVLALQSNDSEHCLWMGSSGTWQIYWSRQDAGGVPDYDAALVADNLPAQMQPGEMATCSLTYQNTGLNAWDLNTHLGTSNPRDRTSLFYVAGDWIAGTRPTGIDTGSCAPGATCTFTFQAQAPMTTGSYSESFELVQEMVTWFNNGGDDVTWNVNVVNSVPLITSASLNTTNVVADGTTTYTLTMQADDQTGAGDIRDMRAMFDIDLANPDETRGYLAWGQTPGDITYYGPDWIVQPAGGEGYWGYNPIAWGHQYIEPISCSAGSSGNQRTVTWVFKVLPSWGSAGPASGNHIGLFARDSLSDTGWFQSDELFNYTFNVSPAAPWAYDRDGDGDIDMTDFAALQRCATGSDRGPVSADCALADLDADQDVDIYDVRQFALCQSAANVPFEANCVNATVTGVLPDTASLPSPTDGGVYTTLDAQLRWHPGTAADSHDVYFGITNPPPFIGNQTANTHDPGPLSGNTTYYWRIDEVNSQGTTTGPLWSFTTEPEFIITNLNRYETANITIGSEYYRDRLYKITNMPAMLQGQVGIKTDNNDKAETTDSWLTFNLNQSATIYVIYDGRATDYPAFMSDFTNTGLTVEVEDGSSPMKVFSKAYAAGPIVLGSNMQAPAANAGSMYWIIVIPS